jgi:methylated-DNA-protein-cysteine methyltransferase-like protein
MLPLDDLWSVIRRIPPGKVASYGEVGRALRSPASGYFVGRWMAQCPPDIPWWRVVAKSGHLSIAKRSPELAAQQERRLRDEGITIVDGRVPSSIHVSFTDMLGED